MKVEKKGEGGKVNEDGYEEEEMEGKHVNFEI